MHKTFRHDLAPIWEDLIDRIRHVDERSVKEGCGMPDSLKPVKSYDWTDEEWLRLMREMDPKEESLPSSVASPSGATQLTTTPCELPYARLGSGFSKDGMHLFTLLGGDCGPRRVCTVARVRRITNYVADSVVHDRPTYYCLTEVEPPLA